MPSDHEPNSDCRLWALRMIQVRYTVSCQPLTMTLSCPVVTGISGSSVLLFRFLCNRALPITASLIHHQGLLWTSTSAYGASYPQRREWDWVLRTEVQAKGTLILNSRKGTLKEADLPSPSILTSPKCWASKYLQRYHSWPIRDPSAQQHIRTEPQGQTKLLTWPGRKRGGREWGLHSLLWGHTPNVLETSPCASLPKVSPPPSNSSVRTFRWSVQVAACISLPKLTGSNEQSTSESQLNNSHSRAQFPARNVSVWTFS